LGRRRVKIAPHGSRLGGIGGQPHSATTSALDDMSLEQVACEDLKAFERRLTEIISSSQPAATRWRVALLLASVCVAVGAFSWLGDPATAEVSFVLSLRNHPFFSASVLALFLLFLWGIHRR